MNVHFLTGRLHFTAPKKLNKLFFIYIDRIMQVERQQKFKSLTIYDMMNKEPGTKEFLESISRNSKGTQKVYAAGLVMFHKFCQELEINRSEPTAKRT